MKRILPLALSIVLAASLCACGKSETPTENAAAETPSEPAQGSAVEKPQAAAPRTPPPATKPAETRAPAEPAAPTADSKAQRAGLGVIFVTDVKEGIFRVKVDNAKVFETAFQGGSFGSKETRVEKELRLDSGDRHLKFAVVDKSNGRVVVREYTMGFKPKSHHVVKLTLTGNDNAMNLEIKE